MHSSSWKTSLVKPFAFLRSRGQERVKGQGACTLELCKLPMASYRRRPNETEVGDRIELVSEDEVDDNAEARIKEENHVIPHPLVLLKRRVVTKTRSPKGKLLYWLLTVSFLGISSLVFVLVPLVVEQTLQKQDCSDFDGQQGGYIPFFYREDTGHFELCRQGRSALEGKLGVGRSFLSEVKVNVYTHSMDSTLNITGLPSKRENCLLVQWTGVSSKEIPLCDCFDIGTGFWYAAYEHSHPHWPINVSDQDSSLSSPFLPHDYLYDDNSFGPILHPLWLNTNGAGIIVDEGVQLHVSMNETQLCLIAQPFELDCVPDALDHTFLNYTVCLFDTIAQTAQYFLGESGLIPRPAMTPDAAVFQKPIWSTWAEFKTSITTEKLSNFCSNISKHNFNVSQLEIDDGYSLHYGELSFNADVSASDLANTPCQNFNITAWVHPFVNYDASNFEQGLSDGIFLPGRSLIEGNSVSLVKWWQGYGAVLNFFNATAAKQHANALLRFRKNFNLSSFKFDGGEYTFFPKCVYIEGLRHPGEFTKAYIKFVGSQPYLGHAEVGYFTQDQSIFTRLLERNSTWSPVNGLQSILDTVLSVGLGGYIFIIPSVIGGTVSALNSNTTKPSLELYIRWCQLSAFLPVMHFSTTPWGYGDHVSEHVNMLTQLHYLLDFHNIVEESLKKGFPVIRPLWWRALEINDEQTWTISDQFYIGDRYMVAPILKPGQYSRTVYFPLGSNYSVELNSGLSPVSPCNICVGGTSVVFNVTLYQVLYFRIVETKF